MMDVELRNTIKSMEGEVVGWRRHLHQNPELSFEENETSEFIVNILKSLGGFEIMRPVGTGIVATIDTGKPGRTVALRAEIDALPIQEENTLDFKSKKSGVMHACAHDGHTAILLGVAKMLSKLRDELEGKIILIFQHAEETPPGGAIELYEAGVMAGVDEIYGLHFSSVYPTGVFGIKSGVLTAATDEFRIKIIGRGGHSSLPEQCIDPIVIGGSIISAIQSIISRTISPSERAVVSICQVRAGTAYNIIPDTMELGGSVRTFSTKVRQQIQHSLGNLSSDIAQAYGGNVEYEYLLGYDCVDNDPQLAKIAEDIVVELFGQNAVLHIDMVYPGEDFSALHRDCKGMFVEVGTADPEKGTDKPHHNAHYMMDEDMLIPSIEYFLAIVLSRMSKQNDEIGG